MAKILVGIVCHRTPTGEFLPNPTPLYEEIPDEQIRPSGMTEIEERGCNELAKVFAEKFKQYIDGVKNI